MFRPPTYLDKILHIINTYYYFFKDKLNWSDHQTASFNYQFYLTICFLNQNPNKITTENYNITLQSKGGVCVV